MERWVRRYWGYPIVVLLLLSWVAFIGGKIPRLTAVVFVLLFSLGDAYYFLFRVPMWCNAVNRNGTLCRENSTGVLWGCHRRQHKWQRLKMIVVRDRWRQLSRELFSTAPQGLATVSSSVAALSALMGSIAAVLTVALRIH